MSGNLFLSITEVVLGVPVPLKHSDVKGFKQGFRLLCLAWMHTCNFCSSLGVRLAENFLADNCILPFVLPSGDLILIYVG